MEPNCIFLMGGPSTDDDDLAVFVATDGDNATLIWAHISSSGPAWTDGGLTGIFRGGERDLFSGENVIETNAESSQL